MGLRRRLYAQLFDVLGPSGLSAFYASRFAGMGVIFMYHRIIPSGAVTLFPGYAVTTDALDACLTCVRGAGWEIVGMDDMHAALLNGRTGQRLACFTFDDGYADNYTLALPIFRKHAARMCLYAATGLVDRSMFYWWGALEHLILTRDEIELDLPNDPHGPRRVRTAALEEKLAAYRTLDGWCHANPTVVDPVLHRLLARYGVDSAALLERDALTPQQLRQMAQDPLVTIGSHAVSHRRLSLLTDVEVARELVDSRQRLEQLTDAPVRHLAYPFGSRDACGRREFDIAARSGYLTGVTTRRGNIFEWHGDHLFSLPRREASSSISDARNAIYGVSSILRREPIRVSE